MKKITLQKIKAITFVFIAALALIFAGAPRTGAASDFPRPTGYVNDFAGVMDPGTKAQIEELCGAVKQKTGAEISIVTVQSYEPYASIDEYAVKLFAAWGIGEKGKDNGVLLVVAMKERMMRIEVGYGLEGAIPDAAAGAIKDEKITPLFKQGDYNGGLKAGAEGIAERVLAEKNMTIGDLGINYESSPQAQSPTTEMPIQQLPWSAKILGLICVIAFIILIIRHPSLLLFFHLSGGGGGGGGWSSGGGGGFGGGFGGFGGGGSGGGGASGGW
jgi:uncharacterized protein